VSDASVKTVSSAVEQRFCNSFFLGRSPLFLCRKTSDFSGFYLVSTIGGTGRPGGTKRYYQAQKQAQLITVCSRLALVEFDFLQTLPNARLGTNFGVHNGCIEDLAGSAAALARARKSPKAG
jgi:hypothetical protein